MYGKVFEQILDSSIAENYLTRFVFEDFIILADPDGNVDMTPEAFSRRTNVPLDIVKAAIVELEKPDPRSKTPDHDGRRLLRLDPHRDWGWHVVNHGKYRAMKSECDRRRYMKDYMREYRSVKQKSLQGLHVKLPVSVSASVSDGKGVEEEIWELYPKKADRMNGFAAICAAVERDGGDEILACTRAYAEAVAKWPAKERRFVPHASTWFNNERYDDDPETWEMDEGDEQPKGPSARAVFERYLNEIISNARNVPPAERGSWMRALRDKYKDVPKVAGVHVADRAKKLIKWEA